MSPLSQNLDRTSKRIQTDYQPRVRTYKRRVAEAIQHLVLEGLGSRCMAASSSQRNKKLRQAFRMYADVLVSLPMCVYSTVFVNVQILQWTNASGKVR